MKRIAWIIIILISFNVCLSQDNIPNDIDGYFSSSWYTAKQYSTLKICGKDIDCSGLLDDYIMKYDLASDEWKMEIDAGAGADEKAGIDSIATPDYVGATSGDGFLRSSSPLTYTDGGDFVTLGINISLIDHGGLGGLSDDDHPQYVLNANEATDITGGTFNLNTTGYLNIDNYIDIDYSGVAIALDVLNSSVVPGAGGIKIETTNVTSALTMPVNVLSNGTPVFQIIHDGTTNIDNGLLFADGTLSRIGILDVTPSYVLDVNGTGRFTGLLLADAGLTVTGTAAATTVTGANVTSGADPGHTHTGSSISGIDISDDTNLAATEGVKLTGDTLSLDFPNLNLGTPGSKDDRWAYWDDTRAEHRNIATVGLALAVEPSIDHGGVAGLGDNDHPQYVLNAGETTNITGGTFDMTTTGDIIAAKYSDTGGTYFLDPASAGLSLNVSGDISIGVGDASDNDYIYFDQNAESMHWDEVDSWFEFSDSLYTTSTVTAGLFNDSASASYYLAPATVATSMNVYGDISIGDGDLTDDDYIYFDGSGESLHWDNASTRFEFSDDIYTALTVSAGYNTDSTHYLGRGAIGYQSSYADSLTIAHIDQMNANDFALRQDYTGNTILNCDGGRSLFLRQGNISGFVLEADGDLWADNDTTWFCDASANAVCYGRNSVDSLSGLKLQLYTANSASTAYAGTKLMLESTTADEFISFVQNAGTSAYAGLLFSDGTGTGEYAGQFLYQHSTDQFTMSTGSSSRDFWINPNGVYANLDSGSGNYYMRYDTAAPDQYEIYYYTSARWHKKDISDFGVSSKLINRYLELQLRQFIRRSTNTWELGFIADEVADKFEWMAVPEYIDDPRWKQEGKEIGERAPRIKTDRWEGVRYEYIPLMNYATIKEQQGRIDNLESEVLELKKIVGILMEKCNVEN